MAIRRFRWPYGTPIGDLEFARALDDAAPNRKFDCVHCRDTRKESYHVDDDRLPGVTYCHMCMQRCLKCQTTFRKKEGHQCPTP